MKVKASFGSSLLFASTFLVSCGAPGKRAEDNQGKSVMAVAQERDAMSLPLAAITVRGELAVKKTSAGEWMPMTEGASITGVREVKTERRGAIVSFGDSPTSPLLYLRAGTRVLLSQDGSGVHVAVMEGRARLRHGKSISAYIDTDGGEVIVTGDVLVDGGAKEKSEVRSTGSRPQLADWSLALVAADTGAGVGRMEARVSKDQMDPLELRSVDVDVKTAGDLAVTEVTHVFHNGADERREGTFRFPVPDGAMLIGMSMEVNGEMMEGEIVEREKARAVYEKIVDEMLDPALLEWEEGNWFKLRVFPLEARADKKVVIRYITPLARAQSAWEYGYSISAPDRGAIGQVTVKVDGQVALSQRNVAQGIDLTIPVALAKVPSVMRETRTDAVYTAVRIAPTFNSNVMPGSSLQPKKLAIVFDTSRSSLEGRAQALELLETTLKELSPDDKFVVLASDVEIAASSQDYTAPSPESITGALEFIKAIEPDGASDLGRALAVLGERAPSDIIYIGDGIPTWGEQGTEELGVLAAKLNAPIEAALIGKGASTTLWSELTGKTGGRAMIVKSQLDERRFVLAAIHADAPKLTDVKINAPAGSIVFPMTAATVFAGDEIVAVMKTPIDQPMPPSVRLTGKLGGADHSEEITLTPAAKTDRVAQRWARQQLAFMEASDAPKDDIVKLSTDLGVLSKYTSLLVLENDEAYKQYQIERKQAEAQQLAQAPQVTGGDLDTLGARQASLSPDEIQPGDPEIKIPAPQNAQSVVVTFPFGETKLAVWDEDASAWMVRFLVDQTTADGEYSVRVTITHADGRLEVLKLPYLVDTKAPEVKVTVAKDATGYKLVARQQVNGARKDADRVEVLLPDGTIMRLKQVAWGKFEGHWATAAVDAPVTLRVVARDPALNQSTSELVIQ
ncbi:MAG: hypothetical protein H0T46_34650 [Deltaproteobacteria bacterium]|nr:hypothetical protein [Deltaproteobacteria bacterium]